MIRATIRRLVPRATYHRGAARSTALLALVAFLGPLVAAGPAGAQPAFTEFALSDTALNSSASTDFWIASAAPADVDADGDLDLVVSGYFVVYATEEQEGSVEERLTLYRNDGPDAGTTWLLTPIALDATGLSFGAGDLAFGDYDGDGDPDLVVGASDSMALYRNDAGTLVRTSTVLPRYWEDSAFTTMDLRSLTWADFDNDGDPDLLVPSVVSDFDYLPTRLLRNDGPGAGDAWTFSDAGAGLPVAPNGASAWADMEGDGDLDLLLGHISPFEDNFLETYRNDAGTLVRADTALALIRYGSMDWGDPDGDGDLDVVYAGNMDLPDGSGGETVVRILFKQGDGSYLPVDIATADFTNPNEPWLDFGAVTWADYDSDGDVDLLVSGEWLGDGEIFGRAVVYANTGGTFAPAGDPLPAPIAGNAGGAFTWMDLDGDGDLDYFVAGAYYVDGGNGLVEARTQLFRNDAPGSNAPPSAPLAAQATVAGDDVTLSWSPASDDDTPGSALTYELEVVESGATAAIEDALPEPGNVSRNTSWTLRGLPSGDYAWRIRAKDNAFEAGPVATGTFSVGTVLAVEAPGAVVALSSPMPNPSSSGVHFTVTTDRKRLARVAVIDPAGRTVTVLHDGWLGAGRHALQWDGRRSDGSPAPAGVYVVQSVMDERSQARRFVVLR
jgi:hypothetical protein